MDKREKLTLLIFSAAFMMLFFETKSCAYLDPGTGSYVLQLVLAFLFAGMLFAKQLWRKLTEFLTKFRPNQKK